MAIHQNHDYSHIVDLESKDESRNQGGIESFSNRLLVKSILMTLEDADWQVDRYGLSRTFRWTRRHVLNEAALHGDPRVSRVHAQTARVDRAPAVGPELEATVQSCSEQPELMAQCEYDAV